MQENQSTICYENGQFSSQVHQQLKNLVGQSTCEEGFNVRFV